MTRILGIDPGLSGALCLYDTVSRNMKVWDMPTLNITRNSKKKRIIDLTALALIVDGNRNEIDHAIIELVGARPGESPVASFSFGFSAGCVQMVVAANFIPYTLVTPSVWKRAMKLTDDKDSSRQQASRLFPEHAGLWVRVNDDGRAEAALLARDHEKEGVL